MSYKLLIINPGSTSTKIGVYEDEKEVFVETLRHSSEEIAKYNSIFDQKSFRKEVIMNILRENNFDVTTLDAIVGRGGMLKPMAGGTYEVNDELLNDLKIGVQGQHASNLGGILANEIAKVFSEKVAEIYNINNIHVVDEAEVDNVPSNVNHTKDIIMFTFIGLVVAVLYVLVLNMLDTTIKTAEEVERQFKVPVLASIPMYTLEVEKGGKKK